MWLLIIPFMFLGSIFSFYMGIGWIGAAAAAVLIIIIVVVLIVCVSTTLS